MEQSAFPHYFDVAFDIVTIGSSLGGLEALIRVLSSLPADFPCPIVVVQHIPADSPAHLPVILGRNVRLSVKRAEAGARLLPRTVYVAPPDRHLLVTRDRTFELADSPRVSFVRPAADLLLHTAAKHFGKRVLAVILTGRGSDGAEGVRAVRASGGTVVVQDESTSKAFGMPSAAIATGCVDFVLPIARIGAALTALVMVRGATSLFHVSDRAAIVV